MLVYKKAELIRHGKIRIECGIKTPLERSTTGPSSWEKSIALRLDGRHRVKLKASDNAKFTLIDGKPLQIVDSEEGNTFVKKAEILPILFHAPEQAFINIEDRCIYGCIFCNNARLSKNSFLQKYNDSMFVDLILKASKREDFKAVALTSGVYPDTKTIIKRMTHIIKEIRKKLPIIPIGVEPYVEDKNEIIQLKEAGADEIKINIQTPNKQVFKKTCPGMKYEKILDLLDYAVEIFGENKVTSNIIYGLGEETVDILNNIELLAEKGVVPNLRLVRINDQNKKRIEKMMNRKLENPPSADYIVFLSKQLKNVLKDNNLTTLEFKTMCQPCNCCDIVPFYDI
ncbi:MAG TPA: radical SAM protein [Thermoplasmatales archaeon]|nr:radical SAM protein [Thermoplasmatales archaeon]